VDLFEEVARMEGYDNIQVTSPHIRSTDQLYPQELQLEDEIREIMIGLGFSEIITYSFISTESIEWLEIDKKSPLRSYVKLLNPLSQEQSVMRTSLIPGVLTTIRNNISYGEHDLKLFEIGKTFFYCPNDKLPEEKSSLIAVISGLAAKKGWFNQERLVDFFDIKGIMETLFKGLHIPEIQLKRGDLPSFLNKEKAAGIYANKRRLGWLGQLSDSVKVNYDLGEEKPYLLELDLEELGKTLPKTISFEPFARYPAVFRDISIIVPKAIESEKINEAMEKVGTDLIESISLFDHYEGNRIAPGEKALTFRISYRSKDRTLSGKEINELHESIIRKIQDETNGRLRDG
jgi:phenylalanyl-tRNA synthetase beta chain